MRVVGECFFWYRLTRVFPDKFHRAVKRLLLLLISDFVSNKDIYMICQYWRNRALTWCIVMPTPTVQLIFYFTQAHQFYKFHDKLMEKAKSYYRW